MDLFVVVVTIAGMPVSLVSTWIIDRIGLRWTILCSTGLAFCGALMKCLVTLPGFEDGVDEGVQYWVTLVAQFLIGVACPLAFCLPNKVRGFDCYVIMYVLFFRRKVSVSKA